MPRHELKRALLWAVALKAVLLALMGVGALALFTSDQPPSTQRVLVASFTWLVILSPFWGGGWVAFKLWKAGNGRPWKVRLLRSLTGGVLASLIFLIPPNQSWPTFLDNENGSLGWRLWEAPKGECSANTDCPQGMRCAQQNGSRNYFCIDREISACLDNSDCATGQSCACVCSPPRFMNQVRQCQAECVVREDATQLPISTFCVNGRREAGPPNTAAHGEPLIALPSRSGPPRTIRLLTIWSPNEGFIPVGDYMDARLENTTPRAAIAFDSDSLPLAVTQGYLFLLSGKFRLSNRPPGFRIEEQSVEEIRLQEAIELSPAFREALLRWNQQLLVLSPSDWERGVLSPRLLGEFPSRDLLDRIIENLGAAAEKTGNGPVFIEALTLAASRSPELIRELHGPHVETVEPINNLVAALDAQGDVLPRVAVECHIFQACKGLTELFMKLGRGSQVRRLGHYELLTPHLLVHLLEDDEASRLPWQSILNSVVGRDTIPTFDEFDIFFPVPLSSQSVTLKAREFTQDPPGSTWRMAILANGGIWTEPVALHGYVLLDSHPERSHVAFFAVNLADTSTGPVRLEALDEGGEVLNMSLDTLPPRSVSRHNIPAGAVLQALASRPSADIAVTIGDETFTLTVPVVWRRSVE